VPLDTTDALSSAEECRYNRRRPHSTIDYKGFAKAMETFFERTELSGTAATINGRLEKEQHFVPETLAQVRRWCHPYLTPVPALPT
jgi:hypothetical protein